MVNARVTREDLDSEMTVVRNEFESGENSPGGVLFQRMQQLAFPWHNYGNAIIGNRSDIEQVPIDRLQAFYRTWYQPDNALLIVAGRFDEARAVELAAKHFGAIAAARARAAGALHARADAGRRAQRDAAPRGRQPDGAVDVPRAGGQPCRLPGDRRADAGAGRRAGRAPAPHAGAEGPRRQQLGLRARAARPRLHVVRRHARQVRAARAGARRADRGGGGHRARAAEGGRDRARAHAPAERLREGAARDRQLPARAVRVPRHGRLAPVLPVPRAPAQGDARRRAARRRALPEARQPRGRRVRAHRRARARRDPGRHRPAGGARRLPSGGRRHAPGRDLRPVAYEHRVARGAQAAGQRHQRRASCRRRRAADA